MLSWLNSFISGAYRHKSGTTVLKGKTNYRTLREIMADLQQEAPVPVDWPKIRDSIANPTPLDQPLKAAPIRKLNKEDAPVLHNMFECSNNRLTQLEKIIVDSRKTLADALHEQAILTAVIKNLEEGI